MTITDPAVSAHADATIGLFEITDHITIDSTQGAHTVEMWCPVIGDGAFQRVLDVEVTSEDPYDLTREPEFGNLMLYSRLRLARRRVGLSAMLWNAGRSGMLRIRHGPARWPRRNCSAAP